MESNTLAGHLKMLLASRETHQAAIERIDTELNEVRSTLGIGVASVTFRSHPQGRERRPNVTPQTMGLVQQQIIETFSLAPVQTASEIERRIGNGITTVPWHLGRMLRTGYIFARKNMSSGKSYCYALREADFGELGLPVVLGERQVQEPSDNGSGSASTDEAGTIAGTAGPSTAPDSTATSEPCASNCSD